MICPPVTTGWRAICPMTWETSVNAPGVIAVRATTLVVTWSAAIRVDSGMSEAATTTGPSVGA